jgi:hypothetical protein
MDTAFPNFDDASEFDITWRIKWSQVDPNRLGTALDGEFIMCCLVAVTTQAPYRQLSAVENIELPEAGFQTRQPKYVAGRFLRCVDVFERS